MNHCHVNLPPFSSLDTSPHLLRATYICLVEYVPAIYGEDATVGEGPISLTVLITKTLFELLLCEEDMIRMKALQCVQVLPMSDLLQNSERADHTEVLSYEHHSR